MQRQGSFAEAEYAGKKKQTQRSATGFWPVWASISRQSSKRSVTISAALVRRARDRKSWVYFASEFCTEKA